MTEDCRLRGMRLPCYRLPAIRRLAHLTNTAELHAVSRTGEPGCWPSSETPHESCSRLGIRHHADLKPTCLGPLSWRAHRDSHKDEARLLSSCHGFHQCLQLESMAAAPLKAVVAVAQPIVQQPHPRCRHHNVIFSIWRRHDDQRRPQAAEDGRRERRQWSRVQMLDHLHQHCCIAALVRSPHACGTKTSSVRDRFSASAIAHRQALCGLSEEGGARRQVSRLPCFIGHSLSHALMKQAGITEAVLSFVLLHDAQSSGLPSMLCMLSTLQTFSATHRCRRSRCRRPAWSLRP